ncbi:nitrogen regulation protein NR(II) [Ottowia sp.]|uniref:nitrogen regulation protein NR(II) n=1 Tax=Ottowia sp. TaxID=1898956 RepID=UPI002C167DEB|nr:nitrogen regulation protein NR(II) [Ottowia sp.]HRN76760.1 nitrogen regulation protein NR(II) [Ottowia sp.]HRQ03872.1 nitrogen regulation protein NR(II) [Ottowia sp.]
MGTSRRPHPEQLQAFDLLATLVAVVGADDQVRFANAALEDAVGLSSRSIEGNPLPDYFLDPAALRQALQGVRSGAVATLRCDAELRRHGGEPIPVHVIVAGTEQPDELVVELLPQEQQARQQREQRLAAQARSNKELFRNLAHEVKNPLGGIRGAAQLLELEVGERGLREYTQVIIREADRLQALVDRLLEPHRHPRVVGDVNIHEVCERVRSLVLAEFPRGLVLRRDYDTSIPELRGDRGQLIQVLLNVVRNAAQALGERITAGDAEIVLRTRVARQITFGGRRCRLALDLHVIDNGPGVPDAIGDRVFLPLVTGRDGGHGLGLTLAQTYVQQHDGLIEVDSQPGRTDFRILLPLP